MSPNNSRKTLLVIDDDQLLCDVVFRHFAGKRIEIISANNGSEGIGVCSKKMVDVVLLDQKLPDGKGVDFCPKILEHNDQAKIIFITAYPSFKNAIDAIKVGAYDYLSKPFEIEELELAVNHALKTLSLEKVEQIQAYRSDKESKETVLIGRHVGLSKVWRMVGMAASAAAPVLITGQTGVGKNVVAKTIHYMSPVKRDAFVSINCAAISNELIEDELFGHVKGAFTGAVSPRKGLFEMAEGGTLFLDEIGALPLQLQSKFLGVLDDKNIRRLGGESERSVDVRIIAATNMEIENAVENGSFREDLYYRLNVMRVHIPPLRQRLQDIPELCHFFVGQIMPDSDIKLPDSEIERLAQYNWPGNVRELRNIIERATILRQGSMIYPSELLADNRKDFSASNRQAPGDRDILTLAGIQKKHINAVLDRFSGNQTRAARALGISRSTLKRKLKAYRIF